MDLNLYYLNCNPVLVVGLPDSADAASIHEKCGTFGGDPPPITASSSLVCPFIAALCAISLPIPVHTHRVLLPGLPTPGMSKHISFAQLSTSKMRQGKLEQGPRREPGDSLLYTGRPLSIYASIRHKEYCKQGNSCKIHN